MLQSVSIIIFEVELALPAPAHSSHFSYHTLLTLPLFLVSHQAHLPTVRLCLPKKRGSFTSASPRYHQTRLANFQHKKHQYSLPSSQPHLQVLSDLSSKSPLKSSHHSHRKDGHPFNLLRPPTGHLRLPGASDLLVREEIGTALRLQQASHRERRHGRPLLVPRPPRGAVHVRPRGDGERGPRERGRELRMWETSQRYVANLLHTFRTELA